MTNDEGMTKSKDRDAKLKPQARTLWLEAKEQHLIFSKIWGNK
jgi:hypothetical protein